MDIADLLHLQAAFHADCVIKPPADKEDITGGSEFSREPLNPFLIFQNLSDFSGKSIQFPTGWVPPGDVLQIQQYHTYFYVSFILLICLHPADTCF